jgi:hypothetical protein
MKTFQIILLFISLSIVSPYLAQTTAEKMIAYTDKMINKKVDRGECWDLVAFALNSAGATWTAPTSFGQPIDYKKEKLQPGDVMVFENTEFKIENGKMFFAQHYALVYSIKDANTIVIAHQNYNNVRKVTLLEIPLNALIKGQITFYRPN